MTSIEQTLTDHAHDGKLWIASCDQNRLALRVRLPSRGNQEWEIRTASPIHLDLGPQLVLGKIEFGGLELLPAGYVESRNFDYGGDLGTYRVLRITDDDCKLHFVVYYDVEQIVPCDVG